MVSLGRMLISAGPTHESIDAVRYLANRSSGTMGVALAEAARDAGWRVTLLLGPVLLEPPDGVIAERFESAAELEALLNVHFPDCDVLIMAAAVADYRPRSTVAGKLPREGGLLTLQLEPTPDLVAAQASRKRPGQMIVAFALEDPEHLARKAAKKLRAKRVDAIVANPLKTMGAADVSATIITAAGESIAPPVVAGSGAMSKRDFAGWLVEWIESERREAGNTEREDGYADQDRR